MSLCDQMRASGPRNRRRDQRDSTVRVRVLCPHCGTPIVDGQQIMPRFSLKIVRSATHPVLSKPLTLCGIIPLDGSPERSDLSPGDQLRQRAAMGGEKERAELAAFYTLFANWLRCARSRICERKLPLTVSMYGRG
jgi:hypothetical protein